MDSVIASGEVGFSQESALTPEEFLASYDSYFPQVYNYICYRCGDVATADDLTSNVFELALSHLNEYRPDRGSLSAWLLGIARNTVSNHYRFERRHACVSLDDGRDRAGGDDTPEEAFLSQETRQALFAALQTLDGRERDLLGLKFGAHCTNRRIAEMTGLSEANVGVILHRALGKLRVLLKA
ncbi:MAG: sigma-70 family RNA polymerase sigma factor [Chloroflexota bacterium]